MRCSGDESSVHLREGGRTTNAAKPRWSRDPGRFLRRAAGLVLLGTCLSVLCAAGAAADRLDDDYAMQPRLDLPRPNQPAWLEMTQAAQGMQRATDEKAPAEARDATRERTDRKTARNDALGTETGIVMLVLMLALGVGLFLGLRKMGPCDGLRAKADLAKDWSSLAFGEILELKRDMNLAWVPGPETIVFGLHEVERGEKGFSARLAGEHDGRAFGFRLRWTMHYGPVALLEWLRSGPESDALIDILAARAGIARGDSSFEEDVRSAAIILDARPGTAEFDQLDRIDAKVCFDLAKGRPEILMDFDFATATGTMEERDSGSRIDLVGAFHAPDKAAPADEDEEPADGDVDEVDDDRSYLPDDERQRGLSWEHDHPWHPIVFRLDDRERTATSFAFRARGEHDGRPFGFRVRVTHTGGRFADCEWWRTGEDSEALIDVIAAHTPRLREHCRFDAHVTAKALIVRGSPANAAFEDLASIRLNVIFDRAMLCPELALEISFGSDTGKIIEIDPSHRWALMSAFQEPGRRTG